MSFSVPFEFIEQVIITILLNGMQLFSAYVLTAFVFKTEKISLVRMVVTTAFFFITSSLLILTLLGMFGLLALPYLLTVVTALFALSVVAYFKYRSTLKRVSLRVFLPSESKNIFFWAFVSVVLFVILVKFFIASLQIVTESDSLVYHMPFVARWLQLQHIWEPYFTAYAGPLGYYPSNYELFLVWFVLPFHSDLMVNLVNFFLYPLFFMLFYLVLRQFSVRYDLALLITFVGTTIPVTLRQLGIPQNDLFFMLFFLYSIYFLFSFLRHRNGLYVSLLGLSLGVFFGTKYTGVPGALPLFVMCLVSVLWAAFKDKQVGRTIVKLLPLFILLFLLGGGFWYLRNFVLTGNPFFPIDVNVLGIKVFSGYKGLTEKVFEEALVSHLGEAGLGPRLTEAFGLSAGFISLTLPLFFIVSLVIFVIQFFKKGKAARKNLLHFGFFIALIPIYLWIYVHAPYTYIHMYPNVRYALPAILLGLLMLGKISSYLKVMLRPIVFFLLASFFAYFFFIFPFQSKFLTHTNDYVWFDVDLVFKYPDLFLLLICLAFSFVSFLFFLFRRQKIFMLIAFAITFTLLLPYAYESSLIREKRGYNDEFLTGEQASSVLNAYAWCDNNIADDAKIAYTSVGSHYHLFGRKFTRLVNYVNINDCQDCLYHDFKDKEKSILNNPSYDAWMRNLKAQEKEYLVVGWKYFDDDPYELIWAKEHPEHFQLLYQEENTYIFKIFYEPRQVARPLPSV